MKGCGNDDEKEKTAEKINEGVIRRGITDNEKETNLDTLNKVRQ